MRWIVMGGVLCGLLLVGCDSKAPTKTDDAPKAPPVATTTNTPPTVGGTAPADTPPANPPADAPKDPPTAALTSVSIKITGMG